MSLTVNDLGLSGEGGVQESEPLVIHLVVDAINDGPLLDLPDWFLAREDVPVLLSGISVSDTDSDEPGGEYCVSTSSRGRRHHYYSIKAGRLKRSSLINT